jgi:hypothetical protein
VLSISLLCFDPFKWKDMAQISLCLFLTSVLFWLPLSQAQFSVSGRQILLHGQPFTVAGVDYSPVPAGGSNQDITIASMSAAHERDAAAMRAANINAIRVYSMEPGVDHSSFLDTMWNNGVQPIYVLVTFSINLPWQNGQAGYISGLTNLLQAYGSHPAIFGFAMGNEINNGQTSGDAGFWGFIEQLHALVHQMAPGKLTVTSVADDGMNTVRAASALNINGRRDLPNLDVWGINSYRGTINLGFGDFYSQFASMTAKPLLFTEFGCPASTRDNGGHVIQMPNNAAGQAQYWLSHWNDMMAHRDVCQGGFTFVWSDEWWKAGTPLVHDAINNAAGAFAGGWWDEEWFGINGISPNGNVNTPWQQRPIDTLQPRAAYYTMTTAYGLVNPPSPSTTAPQTTGAQTTGSPTTAPATTGEVSTGDDSSSSTTTDVTVPVSSTPSSPNTSGTESNALATEAAAANAVTSSSGLNKGGAIAIGITIPAFLFALLLVLGVMWRYRKHKAAARREDLRDFSGSASAFPLQSASSFNHLPKSMRSTEIISAQGSYAVFPSTSVEHMQLDAPMYSPADISAPSQATVNTMLGALKPISTRVPPPPPPTQQDISAPMNRPCGQFSVGKECLSTYSGDGVMYKAIITAYEDGQYYVDYGSSFNNEGEWVTANKIAML